MFALFALAASIVTAVRDCGGGCCDCCNG